MFSSSDSSSLSNSNSSGEYSERKQSSTSHLTHFSIQPIKLGSVSDDILISLNKDIAAFNNADELQLRQKFFNAIYIKTLTAISMKSVNSSNSIINTLKSLNKMMTTFIPYSQYTSLDPIDFKLGLARTEILVQLNKDIEEFNQEKGIKGRQALFHKIYIKALVVISSKNYKSNDDSYYYQLANLLMIVKSNILTLDRDLFSESAARTESIKKSKFSKYLKNLIDSSSYSDLENQILNEYYLKFENKSELSFQKLNRLVNFLIKLKESSIQKFFEKILERKTHSVITSKEILQITKNIQNISDLLRNIIKSDLPHIQLVKQIFLNQSKFTSKQLAFFEKIDQEFINKLTVHQKDLILELKKEQIFLAPMGGQIPVFHLTVDGKDFIIKHYVVYTGSENDYRKDYETWIDTRKRLLPGNHEYIVGKTLKEIELDDDGNVTDRIVIGEYFPQDCEKSVEKQRKFFNKNGGVDFLQDAAIDLALDIIDNLTILNKLGIVFSDLKTSNIRLDKNNKPHFPDTKWIYYHGTEDLIPFIRFANTEVYLPKEIYKLAKENNNQEFKCNYKSWQAWTLGLIFYEIFTNHQELKRELKPSNFGNSKVVGNKHHIVKGNKTIEIKEVDHKKFQFNNPIFKGKKGKILQEVVQSLMNDEPTARMDLNQTRKLLQIARKIEDQNIINSPKKVSPTRLQWGHRVCPPANVCKYGLSKHLKENSNESMDTQSLTSGAIDSNLQFSNNSSVLFKQINGANPNLLIDSKQDGKNEKTLPKKKTMSM